MKTLLLSLLATIFSLVNLSAQEMIKLPLPVTHGGKALMDCLSERHTSRDFVDTPLSQQQLSDLLWAANGINRPESGKRTVANSRNKQEMDVYIVTHEGIFRYLVATHSLFKILDGDHRAITGKQDFVGSAAVNLVYVADYARIGSNSAEYKTTSCINTGLIVQNVYLYCASSGLGTVVRGYFDAEPLHQLMQLGEGKEIILTQSVGAVKE